VSYEVDQGGDAFWVLGGDAQWRLSPLLEIGGSLVQDKNPLAPYDLGSANATLRFGPRTALVAEVARSRTTINTNPTNQVTTPGLAGRSGDIGGNAWRLELAHQGEVLEGRLSVGRSDPDFHNTAAPLNGGRGEAQGQARWRITDTLALQADALSSEDRNTGGGKRTVAGAGLQWQAAERWTFDAGLRSRRETVGTQANGWSTLPFSDTAGLSGSIATGSAGGALGFGNQAVDPATGLPVIGQGGLASAVSSLAAGTRLASDTVRLGAAWRATERIGLGAEVEHDVDGERRRRIALGADYRLAERTRLYARYERQSGWVSLAGITETGTRANALVFGVDSTFLADTHAFSEYRLRDAISGRDTQLASGIRHGFDIAEGLRATAGYEQIQVLSGNTAKAQAIALGLDWTGNALWKAGTRLELRRSGDLANTATDERFTTTLWQVMAARKLDRDWTLLARNHLLRTDYAARGDVLQNRAQLGLAWRPVDHNRFNVLGRIEHKLEQDASNAATGPLESRAWILSTHADWHPSRPWWVNGRLAAKWQTDQLEGGTRSRFDAQLLSGRVVYDITERWDIGALAAAQMGQNGARQHARGGEAGYLLKQNLWLSAGFNHSGFRGDADLTGYEYTQQGVYLRLRFKFDETLWKSRDPQINRSLDR
jgi:predicted porin